MKKEGKLVEVSAIGSIPNKKLNFVQPDFISMKGHPQYNEKWLQDRIAETPEILGLGDLVLRDRERIQPRAGRLDLLLADVATNRRFEVELQLGNSDETHIIRTIEYWDIERKRYPQYEHCAVIIAEDITSRFLNVISLFNGAIPIIAIQVKAVKVGDSISLIFTKVLDEVNRGLVDEDEEVNEPTDRNYWLERSSAAVLAGSDRLIEALRSFAPQYEAKYNKYYIGLADHGVPNNFFVLRPRRTAVKIDLKLPLEKETTDLIENAELEMLDYDTRYNAYRVSLSAREIEEKMEVIQLLMKKAYEYSK